MNERTRFCNAAMNDECGVMYIGSLLSSITYFPTSGFIVRRSSLV
jgi:hypothetical protein